MKITDEQQEIYDSYYIRGQRSLLLSQLGAIVRKLQPCDEVTVAHLISERESAIQALRTICDEHGDNDWDENLHLADIINKHLGDYLEEN